MDDPAPSRFATLDKDKITQEHKALGVFLNPPRYWMFDEFRVFEAGEDQEFGGIKMTWMGVVDVATLQKGIIGGNYFPGYIHRDNSFTYNQGSEVYLLDAPGGEVFVMQSYNAHTDQGLAAEQSPAALGGRLNCQKAGGSGSRPSTVTWWSPRTRPASWPTSCKTTCSTATRAPTAARPSTTSPRPGLPCARGSTVRGPWREDLGAGSLTGGNGTLQASAGDGHR